MTAITARADKSVVRAKRRADRATERARTKVARHEDRFKTYAEIHRMYPANGPVVTAAAENADGFGGQLDAAEHLLKATRELDSDEISGAYVFGVFGGTVALAPVIWLLTRYDYSIVVAAVLSVWIVSMLLLSVKPRNYRNLRLAMKATRSRRPLHPIEAKYLEKVVAQTEKATNQRVRERETLK